MLIFDIAFKNAEENSNTKVIIITGSGEKAFVAGADISEFAHFSVSEAENLALEGQTLLFDFIANLSTPVIAAINGFALGGGLELGRLGLDVRWERGFSKIESVFLDNTINNNFNFDKRVSQIIFGVSYKLNKINK